MIGIFPGRFQPPHVGHILTLMKIYDEYDKIIICVNWSTCGGQKLPIIEHEVAFKIVRDIFKHLPKYEVIRAEGRFTERTTFDDLPKFDVVITGNPMVANNLRSLGIKVDFVPRSHIGDIEISGTRLRAALCPGLKSET